jgi:hypothetical protein
MYCTFRGHMVVAMPNPFNAHAEKQGRPATQGCIIVKALYSTVPVTVREF